MKPDARELPAYGITETAHYLRMPRATLRSWVVGRYYPTEAGRRFFAPVIGLPDKHRLLLSFMNLVEAHVLDATRREHEVPSRRSEKPPTISEVNSRRDIRWQIRFLKPTDWTFSTKRTAG